MSRLLDRRAFLGAAVASLAAAGAAAHTPYRQWVVYRRKHLLIGSHRKNLEGYEIAKAVAETLAKSLPTSKARVARAPAATRLASLLATDQLDLAVLTDAEMDGMAAGEGDFAPYGAIDLEPLTWLDGPHHLVAHARFKIEHALAVREALDAHFEAPG
ncbi:MAG: hypothetical protein AAF318_14120 [Pseudomonadota bacterium]